eukprot:6112831-Amphidinium_carterae.1
MDVPIPSWSLEESCHWKPQRWDSGATQADQTMQFNMLANELCLYLVPCVDGSELAVLLVGLASPGDASFEHDALLRISNLACRDNGYKHLEGCCRDLRVSDQPKLFVSPVISTKDVSCHSTAAN